MHSFLFKKKGFVYIFVNSIAAKALVSQYYLLLLFLIAEASVFLHRYPLISY